MPASADRQPSAWEWGCRLSTGAGGPHNLETSPAALRAADLYEELRAQVHPGGEAMLVLDKDAVVRRRTTTATAAVARRLNAANCATLLLGSLPDGAVRCAGARRSPARACSVAVATR